MPFACCCLSFTVQSLTPESCFTVIWWRWGAPLCSPSISGHARAWFVTSQPVWDDQSWPRNATQVWCVWCVQFTNGTMRVHFASWYILKWNYLFLEVLAPLFNSQSRLYSTHSSSLLKPGSYITHNATQPPPFWCVILVAANVASSR